MTNHTKQPGSTVGSYSGHDLVDHDNRKVGTVTDVIFVDDDDEPDVLIVDPGILSAERVVPLDHAYTAENGNIVIPYDKQHVMHAPKAPHDHVLTRGHLVAVDAHYEVDHVIATGAIATGAIATETGTGRRYVLLADGPVDGDIVRTRLGALEPINIAIHVVVPTRDLTDGERRMVEIEDSTASEGTSPSVVAAQWRLRGAMDALRSAGFDDVTGAIGADDAVDAVEAALDADRFDHVIVVTGPIGVSGWVHLDLPHRIERHVDEPIIHIEMDVDGS